ncbi:hypothetical protein B0I35DRAFT_477927 [Stachybotrys elegans]|uniref:Uncharacterized protein n=1 Tax=Stachybotrys elegans TaxID=80388 RepID=A0A8K0SQQ0_9HYPO|nr:hypothetical protein B0I35DRAFT_477927 [Stachybotrys elegans]
MAPHRRPGPLAFPTSPTTPDTVHASLLSNGYGCAVAYAVAAVLINHIRRVLIPWIGHFLWRETLEGMKTARSSPHYYLQRSLNYEWQAIVFYLVIPQYCLTNGQRALENKLRLGTSAQGKMMDVCRVAYLVLALMTFETVYAETCCVAAQGYAYARILIWGSEAEAAFLEQLARERWDMLLVQAALVLCWLGTRALPTLKSVLEAAVRGHVEWAAMLGCLCYGTAYLVRYSNKYFILLEMRGMLLTFAWMWIGVGCVVFVRIRDWIYGSTIVPGEDGKKKR